MSSKKKIELEHGGYVLEFFNGPERDLVDVNAYNLETKELVMEWRYGKVCGPSLMANAAFWKEQAALQAAAEEKKCKSATPVSGATPGSVSTSTKAAGPSPVASGS